MFCLLSGLLLISSFVAVQAASLQQVTGFGTNPTNTLMYIYVPDRVATNPAILVAMHYCSGTAQAFYSGTGYARLADQYGFIIIYPQAPNGSPGPNCWDVATANTLKNNAGGDSRGIASMVSYTITRYSANPSRVYATGTSSGGMMSQVLAGAYPNLFQAIAPFAGVPFACWAGSNWWNSACANGQVTKTGAQWGDLVRAAYSGYTGSRPRMQIWHGNNDETINFNNFRESIKQWTNVFGVSESPSATTQNYLRSGWIRTDYGPNVQAIQETGQTHNLVVDAAVVIQWMGLDGSSQPPPTTIVTNPPSATTAAPTTTLNQPTPSPSTSQPPTQPTVPKWGQCGGIGWTGGTQCVSGTTCTRLNDWYYQCL